MPETAMRCPCSQPVTTQIVSKKSFTRAERRRQQQEGRQTHLHQDTPTFLSQAMRRQENKFTNRDSDATTPTRIRTTFHL
eukprot:22834-Eustigmatos_ZCMA.PRE.1